MELFKNKKLLIALGIVVLVAIGWYLFIGKGEGWEPAKVSEQALEKSGQYQFDLSFLETEFVKSLEQYGRFPIEKGRLGRSNPFLPY